jgi:hypothetical protein
VFTGTEPAEMDLLTVDMEEPVSKLNCGTGGSSAVF